MALFWPDVFPAGSLASPRGGDELEVCELGGKICSNLRAKSGTEAMGSGRNKEEETGGEAAR